MPSLEFVWINWFNSLEQQRNNSTIHKLTDFASLLFTVLLLAVGPDKHQRCDNVDGILFVGNCGMVEPGLRERVCGEAG